MFTELNLEICSTKVPTFSCAAYKTNIAIRKNISDYFYVFDNRRS